MTPRAPRDISWGQRALHGLRVCRMHRSGLGPNTRWTGILKLASVRFTDDVKESIALAMRLASKANRKEANARDYLQALLMTRRKFNRLDALLDALQAPSSELKLSALKPGDLPPAQTSEDVLDRAAMAAKARLNGHAGVRPVVVDVEHLLEALCQSSDPLVEAVFGRYQIHPERLSQAVNQVEARKAGRTVLFFAKELAEVVGFVLVFLILIKSFLGELRLIPSESMLPGLQVQDRLVIERLSSWWRPYQRGDILVFYPPMTELRHDPWSLFLRLTGFSGLIYQKEDNVDVAYIKRLIALPGDTVEVRPGVGVFVNGKKLDEPYISELANTCTFVRPEPVCETVTVPPGSFYVMGDNRNQSLDSRYWGYATDDRIIGRAVFRIWPLNRIGTLDAEPSSPGHLGVK